MLATISSGDFYGAPFVTSRILLTEYNSVGQNTILSNRMQFCLTEYNSV